MALVLLLWVAAPLLLLRITPTIGWRLLRIISHRLLLLRIISSILLLWRITILLLLLRIICIEFRHVGSLFTYAVKLFSATIGYSNDD